MRNDWEDMEALHAAAWTIMERSRKRDGWLSLVMVKVLLDLANAAHSTATKTAATSAASPVSVLKPKLPAASNSPSGLKRWRKNKPTPTLR
jgi:hypothetical protein